MIQTVSHTRSAYSMPFLGDLRFVPSSDDSDEDLSFEKPRGRGKGKQWTVLHSYGTAEEFKDNYPSRDDFLIRNKRITATNGLVADKCVVCGVHEVVRAAKCQLAKYHIHYIYTRLMIQYCQ